MDSRLPFPRLLNQHLQLSHPLEKRRRHVRGQGCFLRAASAAQTTSKVGRARVHPGLLMQGRRQAPSARTLVCPRTTHGVVLGQKLFVSAPFGAAGLQPSRPGSISCHWVNRVAPGGQWSKETPQAGGWGPGDRGAAGCRSHSF